MQWFDLFARMVINNNQIGQANSFLKLSPSEQILYIGDNEKIYLYDTSSNLAIAESPYNLNGSATCFDLAGYISGIAPIVEITAPQPGETIQQNKPYQITWNTKNGSYQIGKHLLEISTDQGQTFSSLSAPLTGSTQRFQWTPTNVLDNAQIRITALDYSGQHGSSVSGSFSVVDNTPSDTE